MEPYFKICTRVPKICLQEKSEQFDTKHGLSSVCPNVNTDDSHILQMHTTNMDMFVSSTFLLLCASIAPRTQGT